jgi:DNA polymerase III subunit beta
MTRLVATDGHRLALAVRPIGETKTDVSGIVPRKAVQEIASVVGSGEQVEVALGDNQFMLRMPNVILMARLIEGTFPNCEQVVPRAHPARTSSAAQREGRRGL